MKAKNQNSVVIVQQYEKYASKSFKCQSIPKYKNDLKDTL